MKALSVLFAGGPCGETFEPLYEGKNSVSLTLEQAKKFPGVEKTVLLAPEGDFPFPEGVQIELIEQKNQTRRGLLEKIAELQAGFDCAYFAFADCPFLDPALAGSIAERHIREKADYSYADGFPYGVAPEILSPGTAAILAKISGDDDGPVTRDMLFSVIQKDINAFDIETEISAVDLRCHRLSLCADSKRDLLLLKNFISAAGGKIPSATEIEKIVETSPDILRTLPAFFPIQVYGGCPQKCTICPYPLFTDAAGRGDFMEKAAFSSLLDKITSFCGDAVIDLSLWGELSLHPEKMKLIEDVVSRNALALVIETSGIGWKEKELEDCARLCSDLQQKQGRKNPLPPLSWIVSMDTADSKRYMELRGAGFAEAENCAKKLLSLFPKDCYVQAVRLKDSEDDTEKFYRYWKDSNVIIQKYDDFCGALEKKQASDISPVIRKPCWHIMRDMPVLIDGTVPLCREDTGALKRQSTRVLGNVFSDSLENIWKKGDSYYKEQCGMNYSEPCKDCDEYYTFNF
jgi:spiro-SPASM protein